jgi:glutaredoxin
MNAKTNVRTSVFGLVHRAMTSEHVARVPGASTVQGLAQRANRVLGLPIASAEELTKRDAAAARLRELREAGASGGKLEAPACPVTLYREGEQFVLDVRKIEELLTATGVAHRVLDLRGDETMQSFVRLGLAKAGLPADTMPVLFVADRAVGGYREWVEADASGKLKRWLAGDQAS